MSGYTYAQVLEASLNYFHGNELSTKVFVDKYALKDNDGKFVELTPHDMHDRLAKEFARIDSEKYGQNYDERFAIYRAALDSFARICAQGSPMCALGNPYQKMSASNCVAVESPSDSIGGIIETGKNIAQLYKRRCGVGLDLSTLRPDGSSVNNAAKTTSGAWSFADFYSYITRMIGQCIAKGERVLTQNGLKKIEDVIPNIDYVWTKAGWIIVRDLVANGKKEICKTTTAEGYSIRTSKDHVFLTENNGDIKQQRLEEFKIGDSIILIPGTEIKKNHQPLQSPQYTRSSYNNSNRLNNEVKFPPMLDEKLAYFLGYSYGDGCVELDRGGEECLLSLSCSDKYPEIKNRLSQYCNDLFNYAPYVKRGDGKLDVIMIHSKLILQFLKQNHTMKEKAENINVPKLVLDSPSSVQMAFIGGFLDADGNAQVSKKAYRFVSISRNFIQNLHTILLANGVVSKMHTEKRSNKGWKDIHVIYISGTTAQKKLTDLISSSSVKVSQTRFISKQDNYLTPYKASTLSVSHNRFSYIPSNAQFLSVSAYSKVIQEPNVKSLGNVLIKSCVASIENDGHEETFDLILDSEHLFWCEGFYVHNSGRRGACMLTLDVHHPDVVQFTTMKHDKTKVTGANVSLRLSDAFFRAVENNEEYEQRWPMEGTPQITKKVSAREVWNTIVQSATNTAEPGLLMWDKITSELPAHYYPEFKTVSVNPCSEISLSSFDSCRLISINLTGYVREPFTGKARFDFDAFASDVKIAQQMADNLVDLELELIEGIQQACGTEEKELWQKLWNAGHKGRRTGTGTHGLADTLAQLCLRYDSNEAIKMVDDIYHTLRDAAYNMSIDLAKSRGVFPVYNGDLECGCPFIQRLPKDIKDRMRQYGRRNIALLTQAPTGSVSIISKVGQFPSYNVSSGVEPVFRNSYVRRKKINHNSETAKVDFTDVMGDKWQEFKILHTNVENYLTLNGLTNDDRLPDYFVTSDQIDWNKRIEMQGVEQQYIDHSISSTINLPRGTPPEIVGDLYMKAWKHGLKGVTVYVDGSRDGILISEKLVEKGRPTTIQTYNAPKRLQELPCNIRKAKIQGEQWTIFVGLLDGRPYEVFGGLSKYVDIPNKHKTGKIAKNGKVDGLTTYNLIVGEGDDQMVIRDIANVFENANFGAFTRTISLALRHGTPVQYVVEQLQKDKHSDMTSFSKVIGRVLKTYITDGTKSTDDKRCPTCKQENSIVYQEGCLICTSCSYSRCS